MGSAFDGGGLVVRDEPEAIQAVYRFKARRFQEVDVYAIDDTTPVPAGMRLIRDKPGHASLVVTERMPVRRLTENLVLLSQRAELIGRIKVSP